MQTTSHFIGIELRAEILSDIFVNVYKYLQEKDIVGSVNIQNPLSPHITLYYLEKEILNIDKKSIKNDIEAINVKDNIYVTGINYFLRNDKRFVLYFTTNTTFQLEEYRNNLHEKYNRDYVEDNSFKFSPHITFLRILDSKIFEKHRLNIENIIGTEIEKLKNININSQKIHLYAVNSTFREEIQVKI